ncbi:hypothetical protein [Sulfurivirga sp.]|uniref:hypothetical protein n=1 Tax=Sulfurivirga sp. TaxID=2614236 RepID=UPI0025FB5ADF|nr:hypothetical protein [Sulfurivirga sp.]
MMHLHLTKRARALFDDSVNIAPAADTLPTTGLNWWVDVVPVTDAENGEQVPVCMLVEEISRYALLFPWAGPQFVSHFRSVVETRLTTHMALLFDMAGQQGDRDAMEETLDLMRTMAARLTERLDFHAARPDESVLETFAELKAELEALPTLPRTQAQAVEQDVHANQQVRSIGNDSVMPHEQFAQLLNLYITSQLMDRDEAERFVHHLHQTIQPE